MSKSSIQKILVLVSGIPRAGKSTFADQVEKSALNLTHIPMDSYIGPTPEGLTFLEWVKTPDCVDWSLMSEHIEILNSGQVCYAPAHQWTKAASGLKEDGTRQRICEGGALQQGKGRLMMPSPRGYVLPGTHIFAFPFQQSQNQILKVFISTEHHVVAERISGNPCPPDQAQDRISQLLKNNHHHIETQISEADLVIDGNDSPESQITMLEKVLVPMF